jgi:hypothetical protein
VDEKGPIPPLFGQQRARLAGLYAVLNGKGGHREMYWYNPKTRSSERIPAPTTDEQAIEMLEGHPDSGALVEQYVMLREEGMGVEQALFFVGHRWRMFHLRFQPVR